MSFAEGYEGEEEPVSELTRRRLELMVSIASISSEEKAKCEQIGASITEEEAMKLIEKLKDYMPIMGLHRWPHGQKEELGQAIRYQVAKDNLHELRWKK